MPRRLVAVASLAVLAALTAGCRGSEEVAAPTTIRPDTDSGAPEIDPIPPSTAPDPVPAYDCDLPLAIAENMLLERRQGAPASKCATPDPWHDTDRDFVDFTLDRSAPSADTVRFVAHYRTSDTSFETRAETLSFEQRADGTWKWTGHGRIDLSDDIEKARRIATDYFDALHFGDHRTAAELLAPSSAFTRRPDLDRLDADGMLDGRTVADITDALAAWCTAGARCGRPDDVQYEIRPDHHIRIVATYQVGPTDFDAAFDTDGSVIVGIPPKV